MGHFSLDFKKAKGSSDARESDHIERKVIPDNADPTRTHLNRELVKMPSGVYGRDEAIAHRIKTAGIKRKITNDQVRVIRTVLSGTHEDMMNIAANGQLDDWCNDSLKWLQDTFGKENVVSVVLHMDEHTPHLHASIVPIVTGEHQSEVANLESKHTTEVTMLNNIICKAKRWFPMLEARLQMEDLCRKIGFTVEQIGVLLTGKAVNFSGSLYSEEYRRKFNVVNAEIKIFSDSTKPNQLFFVYK